MTVTVAIPSIPSRSGFLAEALDSVSKQTHLPDAVAIAYDRGHGAWETRNWALEMVQTKYTAFLDDDDTLLPNHLEVLLSMAETHSADLVYPWFEGGEQNIVCPGNKGVGVQSPYGVEFGWHQMDWLLHRDNFIPITFLVRTELAKEVGGFPKPSHDKQYAAEDWEFLKSIARAGGEIYHAPVITWKWRIHDGRTKGWQEKSSL